MPHFLSSLVDCPSRGARLVTNQATIAHHLECAFDSASRRRGLLGRDGFDVGRAIVIAPCNAVHTFFMKFSIDVVFVDRGGTVLKTVVGLKPWRLAVCVSAFATIELPADTLGRVPLAAGSRVTVEADD